MSSIFNKCYVYTSYYINHCTIYEKGIVVFQYSERMYKHEIPIDLYLVTF